MCKSRSQNGQIPVVWGLPSHLISQVGRVPVNVQLDIMSTGWSMLRRLRGQPCSLLLIHWELSDGTGPSLAGRVRLLHSALPIVLTTDGEGADELKPDLASLRVLGPVGIPVDWQVLIERLEADGSEPDIVHVANSEIPASMGRSHVLHGS